MKQNCTRKQSVLAHPEFRGLRIAHCMVGEGLGRMTGNHASCRRSALPCGSEENCCQSNEPFPPFASCALYPFLHLYCESPDRPKHCIETVRASTCQEQLQPGASLCFCSLWAFLQSRLCCFILISVKAILLCGGTPAVSDSWSTPELSHEARL
jgi:hypothetical protein